MKDKSEHMGSVSLLVTGQCPQYFIYLLSDLVLVAGERCPLCTVATFHAELTPDVHSEPLKHKPLFTPGNTGV